MNFKTKVSPEHRLELAELYCKVGLKGVEARARELGVTARYAANAANLMGMRRESEPGRAIQTCNDHRWSWAIERGAIVR